jgi:hypothetical protein
MPGILPNFLIIGAMKAGTTSLHRYLSAHPDVFMPAYKEIHFFNRDSNWERGADWYSSHFIEGNTAHAIGEASPGYTMYPHRPYTAERIASLLPEVRLIYIVRDPIERMQSHYAHLVADGQDVGPIDRALLDNPLFVDMSRYALQIEHYLEYFERDQLLVITSERLRYDRAETMGRVCEFLKIDRVIPVVDAEFHQTASKRVRTRLGERLQRLPGYASVRSLLPGSVKTWASLRLTAPVVSTSQLEISATVRGQLEELLRPDVQRLFDYLNNDFQGWGIAPRA